MKNITGTGKSWITTQELDKPKEEQVTVEKIQLDLSKETEALAKINSVLKEKYDSNHDKSLYDTINSIDMALLSLENFN